MRKSIGLLVALTAMLGGAREVAAQDVDGVGQLALGIPVLAYIDQSTEVEVSGGGSGSSGASGFIWGVAQAPRLEFGYGLSDMFVLGGLVQLGGTSLSLDNSDQELSGFELFLAPKLDLVFSPGADVRPFVGAAIGLAYVSGGADGGTAAGAAGSDVSAIGFGLVARVGLRYFVAPGLSIDPHLALDYTSLTWSQEVDGFSFSAPSIDSTDVTFSTLQFGLHLALSGWL